MLARTDSVIPTYTEGGRLFLSFADARLEARYQAWYSRNYRKSLHMRLLVATFLYFLLAVAFTAWAHINSHSITDWPHLMTISDTVMGLVLSMSFALSFCPCAARRPQVFSSIVLLVTIAFVVLRSTLLDIAAVYSAPVLLVLIVCLLLGSTLLRMPCGSTLFVGLVTCAIWGAVALLELRRAPDGSAWEPVALFLVVGAATLAAGQLERLQRHLFLMQYTRSHDASHGRSTSTRGNTREDLRPHASSDCSQPGSVADIDRLAVNLVGRDGSRASGELAGYMCPSPPLYGMASPCTNSELLGPLLAAGSGPGMPSPVAAHVARGHVQGGDSASMAGVGEVFSSLPHRHSPTTSSAPSALDAALAARDGLQGPSALDTMRDALRELLTHPQGGATSIEAVQHALRESGNASLAQYLGSYLVERGHNLAERLHLPHAARTVGGSFGSGLDRSGGAGGAGGGGGSGGGGAACSGSGGGGGGGGGGGPHLDGAGGDDELGVTDEEVPLVTFALVSQPELPPWFTPYPFIETGYRACFSYRLCWVSLFRLHNELINVWTELLPAAFFAVWTYHFLEKHASAPKEDRYIIAAGLIGSCVVRPLCSGLAHLFYCTSMSGYIVWWSVDYISICFAILASSIVSGRLAFYCLQPLQILFFTSTAGLLSSSLVAVLSISSASLRAASFVLFVLFCNGVPFCYTVGVKLATGSRYHQDVPWEYVHLWALSLGTFVLGLVVKQAMLPERIFRSTWTDIFFASHQLWHVAINVGFWLGTFSAWDVYLVWRHDNMCPSASDDDLGSEPQL